MTRENIQSNGDRQKSPTPTRRVHDRHGFVIATFLLLLALIGALGAVHFARHSTWDVRFDMRTAPAGLVQLYYRAENGQFSEANSRPLSVYTRNTTVTTRLSASRTFGLRLDPPAGATKFAVCQITVITPYKTFSRTHPPVASLSQMRSWPSDSDCSSFSIAQTAKDPNLTFGLNQPALHHLRQLARKERTIAKILGSLAVISLVLGLTLLWRTRRCRDLIDGIFRFVHVRPATIFIMVALSFGLCDAIITPPGAVPDADAHLAKIAALSQGALFGAPKDSKIPNVIGNYAPISWMSSTATSNSLERAVKNTAVAPLICKAKTSTFNRNALGYSPLPYLLSTLTYRVTCSLSMPFGAFLYVSRILNLLLAVLLVALGIRWAGPGRWLIAVVACLPMTLYLFASISADSLAIAASLSFLGLVSGIASGKISAQTKTSTWLMLLGILVALSKPGYVWVVFLSLLTYRRFRRNDVTPWRVGLALIIPVLAHLAYLAIAAKFAIAPTVVNVQLQRYNLLHHPQHFLRLWLDTFFGSSITHLYQEFIGVLGWLNVKLNVLAYSAASLGLVLAVLTDGRRFQIGPFQRSLAMGLALASLLALSVPLYLEFTSTHATVIQGLQGRYFTVSMCCLLLGLTAPLSELWSARSATLAVLLILICQSFAVSSLLHHYY